MFGSEIRISDAGFGCFGNSAVSMLLRSYTSSVPLCFVALVSVRPLLWYIPQDFCILFSESNVHVLSLPPFHLYSQLYPLQAMEGYPLMDMRVPPDLNDPDPVHNSLRICRLVAVRVLETILRLPGLILMELWWRNRDISFEEITQEMLKKVSVSVFVSKRVLTKFLCYRLLSIPIWTFLPYWILFTEGTLITLLLLS